MSKFKTETIEYFDDFKKESQDMGLGGDSPFSVIEFSDGEGDRDIILEEEFDFYPEESEMETIEFDEMPEDLARELESGISEEPELLPEELTPEDASDPLIMTDNAIDMAEDSHMDQESYVSEEPKLPGTDMSLAVDDKEEEDDSPGTWKDDEDVRDFMRFIDEAYKNIPRHDGTTILGCERAINYLNDLNKQISKAISLDRNNVLDISALDEYRVNMIRDMLTLKEHTKKLNREIKDKYRKKADSGEAFKVAGTEKLEFVKEATVARPQLVITPFERFLSGVVVNSVISGGKPFDDVFEDLKKEYKLDKREVASLLQLIMDMGYPIFKDRALFGGEEGDKDEEGRGLDFIKNYFA